MVLINKAINELTVKLVYYGPGLCGKTTNLEKIYGNPKLENKGKMISMSTETDRTLFFDFMPMDLGTIAGQKVRCQLYTVPGQVFYDATRKLVLRGTDGVVFVADSQDSMRGSNLASLENLKTNLRLNRLDPDKIALVFQFNKRDLPTAESVDEMTGYLEPGNAPVVEAVAKEGVGVTATLRAAITRILENLRNNVDVSLPDAPELAAPDMTAKSGVTASSAGVPKISTAGGQSTKSTRVATPPTAPSFGKSASKRTTVSSRSSVSTFAPQGSASNANDDSDPFADIEASIDNVVNRAASPPANTRTSTMEAPHPATGSSDEATTRALLLRAHEIVRALEAALDLAKQNERELAERVEGGSR